MIDAIRKMLAQAALGPTMGDGSAQPDKAGETAGRGASAGPDASTRSGSQSRPDASAGPGAPAGSGASPGSATTPARAARHAVPPDDVAVAACTLLLEIAHADGKFAAEERRHIESAMARHFNLDPAGVAELMGAAESERHASVDHFQYTRQLAASFDLGQKTLLAEIMWGVILADGQIATHEEYLVRKMANLLDLTPGYLSQARRAAGEKGNSQGRA